MAETGRLEARVLARAADDEAFRARLIADPKAAIQEAVGVAIPDDFTVRIHQETATDFHLVVPPAGGAMSDAEIEEASRGGNW